MTHLERFINNVTPLDAKHLNELVNTLNALVDNNESTQLAIRDLNEGVQNIDVLRTQLDTIENTVDEHIENCSGGEIELQVGNGYIQWRYKDDNDWNNLISITDLQVSGPPGPQGIPGNDGMDGATGCDGKSAYEIAVSNGFVGTEQEWLNSLKGDASGVATGDRIDYMGKQHATLKETNDSNVDYLLRRVNTQKYEGSSITASNTYAKQVNNVILKGITKFKDLDTGELLDSFEEGKNLELVGSNGKEIVASNSILRSFKTYDIIAGRIWQGFDDMAHSEIVSIDDNSVTFNYKSSYIRGFVIKNVAIKNKGKYTMEFTHSEKPEGWNGKIGMNINTYKNGIYLNQYYNNGSYFKFDNNKQRYYFEFDISDDCDSINISPTIDVGSGIHKFENILIYNSSYKGIEIKKESSLTINTICYNIPNAYDYIDLKTGTHVKNIEIRPYQSGDESNGGVLTDKKNTLYKLEQPIVSKIDLQGQKIYSYDGVTHYTCKSESGYPSPILSMEVPTDLASLVNSQKAEIKLLKVENKDQDELINTTMMATDEMYMLIEPLLTETLSETNISKMVDMYVAMVQRQLKKIENVPDRYREQVKKIIDQSVEISNESGRD